MHDRYSFNRAEKSARVKNFPVVVVNKKQWNPGVKDFPLRSHNMDKYLGHTKLNIYYGIISPWGALPEG